MMSKQSSGPSGRPFSGIAAATAGLLFTFLVSGAASADPGKPNFMASVYADGGVFGTKGTTTLPAPTANNLQSFDVLYAVSNSNNPEGQLAIGEAAPGNPEYNGGRWFTHTVEWTAQGFMDHGIVPVLKSQEEVLFHESLGHLVITPGSFPGGPAVYFQCPLLPVK